jgi:hypothetical protein
MSGFDAFTEKLCKPFYNSDKCRPLIPTRQHKV